MNAALTRTLAAACAWLAGSGVAHADTAAARCDIYPRGEDRASAMLACQFSQRQGYVTIRRADGVLHDLSPAGDAPGRYRDQHGRAVSRDDGMGDEGLIFRFPDESVFVYWSTAGLAPEADADNPTAPYTTKDYDATTLLRCTRAGSTGNCPAGILRMEGGQASIVVTGPDGREFTLDFMKDHVNATAGREVKATLRGDVWTVTVDGTDTYEVPLSAIEGG
jgi:hypothetical protein